MSEAGTGRAIRGSDRNGSSPSIQRVRSPKDASSPVVSYFVESPHLLAEFPFPSGLHTKSGYIDANSDFLEGSCPKFPGSPGAALAEMSSCFT
jgi:hypothetical protein